MATRSPTRVTSTSELVDAQDPADPRPVYGTRSARRVQKVRPRLSAGRVQRVAARLMVERERERMHPPRRGGDVAGIFAPKRAPTERAPETFSATLVSVDDTPARHRPRGGRAPVAPAMPTCCTWTRRARVGLAAGSTAARLSVVSGVEEKPPAHHRPYPPFIDDEHAAAGGRGASSRWSDQPFPVMGPRGAAFVRERLHHLRARRLEQTCRRQR